VLSELRAKFKGQLMESTVNFNTKLKEAASFGQPITEYDPGSRGYKDFVQLARELMGQRPLEIEETPGEPMTRPAELVQRAKALANLTNLQFGRNIVQVQPLVQPVVMLAATGTTGGSGVAAAVAERVMERVSERAVERGSGVGIGGGGLVAKVTGGGGGGGEAMVASAPMMSMVLVGEYPELGVIGEVAAAVKPAKTTDEKLAEFYGVKRMGGEVVFAAQFGEARTVQLAGDFNNWSPMATPMRADERGRWLAALPLRPGRYRYRLVVDGQWRTDPANTYVESNQFGELNNIVEVD